MLFEIVSRCCTLDHFSDVPRNPLAIESCVGGSKMSPLNYVVTVQQTAMEKLGKVWCSQSQWK